MYLKTHIFHDSNTSDRTSNSFSDLYDSDDKHLLGSTVPYEQVVTDAYQFELTVTDSACDAKDTDSQPNVCYNSKPETHSF